ncbi:MAG: hypothetical protein ACTSQ5_01885 [Promethearchaeota archaeon]
MSKNQTEFDESEAHKHFAKKFNNTVWEILEKKEKSEEDKELLINAAHASKLHWKYVGALINEIRGYWMLSRVYSVVKKPESALLYSKKCLQLCERNKIIDFDLAYAYEACARAAACSGNKAEFQKYFILANDAASKINDNEDRKIFESDLNGDPWFGFKV